MGCKPKVKRPLKKDKFAESMLNIGKTEAPSFHQSKTMVPMGIKNMYNSNFVDILKHKELVDSMEMKVQRNDIMRKLQRANMEELKHRNQIPTKTTALRSSLTQKKIRD